MYNFTKLKQTEVIKSLILLIFMGILMSYENIYAKNNVLGGFRPIANNDSVAVYTGNPILFNPLSNDTDQDNNINPSSLAIIAGPLNGQATIYLNQIGYLPNNGFIGTDTIWYEIADFTAMKDTAYAVIHVLANPCTLVADYSFSTDNTGLFSAHANPSNSNLDFIWDLGDGNSSTDSVINHTFGASNTYTVCLIIIDSTTSCMDSVCKSITIAIDTTPPCSIVASFTGNSDTTGYATFTADNFDNNLNYVWHIENDTIIGSTANYQYSADGNYNVTLFVFNSDTTCSDTTTQSISILIDTVSVNPCSVISTFTSTSDSTGFANFTADDINNNFTYNWIIESDTLIGSSVSYQYSADGIYNVSLIVFNSDTTCSDTTSQSININITTTPTCTATLDVQIDPSNNGAITVTANPDNAVSYTWDYGDSTIVSGSSFFNAYNYSSSGTYNVCVTVTDSNSCVAQACSTISVTIFNFTSCGLAATITGAVSANGTANFTAGPQNLFTGISYVWEYGDGSPNDTTGGGLFGGETSTHTYTPGTYQACVYATNDMGNCADYACTTLVVNAIDTTACNYSADFTFVADSTGTVDFTASPGGFLNNNYTYDWSFGDGNVFTGSGFSPNTASNIYSTSGNYTVCLYMTEVADGCADTICQTITVFKDTVCNLTADFTYTQDSLGTVNYTASPGGILNNDYTYEWAFGDGNTSTGNGGLTPNTASNQFATVGQYNTCLVVTQIATGCKDTVCHMVDVIIDTTCNITASFTFTQDSTGNVTLTGEPSALLGGFTYIWSYDDGSANDTTSGFFGNQSTHNYSTAGAYNICVTVIEDASGCSNTYCDLVNVIIDTTCSLNVFYTYTQDSTGNLTFTANPSSFIGGYTYIWNYDDGSLPDTTTGFLGNTTTHNYPVNGQFNTCVTVIEDATGCTNTYCELVNVIVDTTCNLTASFNYTQDSTGLVNFTASPSNLIGGYTYIWNFGDGSAADTTSGLLVANTNNHNYAAAGNYNVCITVIEDASACSNTVCQTVGVVINGSTNCNAVANFSTTINNLSVSITDLSSSNNDPIVSYSWTYGDGNQSNTNSSHSYTYSTAGTYNVCLIINTQNNCTSNMCSSITVTNPTPTCSADYNYSTGTPTLDATSVDFTPQSIDTVNYNYNWNFGDATANSTNAITSHIYTANGNYNACLTITHKNNGCSDTVCKNINITGIGFADLTSNKVKLNLYPNPAKDYLAVDVKNIQSKYISIEIYNVNGALVYSNTLTNNKQNGELNINTDFLISGTYMLKIRAEESTGNAIFIKE